MERIAGQISDWLRERVQEAGARGLVVGLSGGIDSACTAALCLRAVGDAALGVIMPCHSDPRDGQAARLVANSLNLQTVTVDLAPVFDLFRSVLTPVEGAGSTAASDEMARANVKPRLRMTTLYYYASLHHYLVAGTGNKSEIMAGYFTKYGDGGVDLEPLGDLYKWQVRALARALGVPKEVIDRPPSAGLWPGQTDEGEMGITYDELDAALAAVAVGQTAAVPSAVLSRVESMTAASEHKRRVPPVCRLV